MDFNQPPFSPIEPAKKWFDEAELLVPTENPLAMTLSTSLQDGSVSSRIVLMKSFSRDGAIFFTNYEGDKAKEIEINNSVSLLFHWDELLRQIRIKGIATKVASEISDKYFATRSRLSQIGAWASKQSKTIQTRSELINRVPTQTAEAPNDNPIARPRPSKIPPAAIT